MQRARIFVLGGELLDGAGHFVDHMILASHHFRAQRDFFQQLPVLIDRRDAKIRAAEIHSNGEIAHNGSFEGTIWDFQFPIVRL